MLFVKGCEKMKFLLDSENSKKIDDYSINEVGIPSLVLQERAALCIAEGISKKYDKNTKIIAVCGTGNNGADGLCLIKILHTLGFLNLNVAIVGNTNHCTEEFMVQKSILLKLNIPHFVIENEQCIAKQNYFCEYDVIIDGIFGIGLSRNIAGAHKLVIEQINASDAYKIAVDIPSGVCGSNGKIYDICVKADETYTFGAGKLGMYLYPSAMYTGEIHVVNIGFPIEGYESLDKVFYLEKEDLKDIFLQRLPNTNKGSYGKLMIFAGNENMCGAALLCAKAAFYMGCGLVKIITTQNNKEIINNHLPEAIVVSIPDKKEELEALILSSVAWCTTILAGPGMGESDRTNYIIEQILKADKPTVIDADGINALSKDESLMNLLHSKVVITPHLGEMSRFSDTPIEQIRNDLIGFARKISNKYKINLVMKDARTIIVNRNNQSFINMSGNSGMAKAGSGDVLAGILAGLVATGMQIEKASYMAPFVHGIAGDIAKEQEGIYSMLPSDIILALKKLNNI